MTSDEIIESDVQEVVEHLEPADNVEIPIRRFARIRKPSSRYSLDEFVLLIEEENLNVLLMRFLHMVTEKNG